MAKPSVAWIKTSKELDLIDKSRTITKMTGESDYFHTPPPSPALAIIDAAIDAFEAGREVASPGGKDRTAHKKALRLVVENLMYKLALYVTDVANGNEEIIIASGFPVQKSTHNPVGDLPVPTGNYLERGVHSGTLDAGCDSSDHALWYEFVLYTAASPTVKVQSIISSSASCTFINCTPATAYLSRVRVSGTGDPSDLSDPASEICG